MNGRLSLSTAFDGQKTVTEDLCGRTAMGRSSA